MLTSDERMEKVVELPNYALFFLKFGHEESLSPAGKNPTECAHLRIGEILCIHK